MSSDQSSRNEAWAQQITVLAFLGGTQRSQRLLSFFNHQISSGFLWVSGDRYFSVFITLIATISSLFAFANLMKMTIAAGWVNEEMLYGKTGCSISTSEFFGLLIVCFQYFCFHSPGLALRPSWR
jgi:hypothetical protein